MDISKYKKVIVTTSHLWESYSRVGLHFIVDYFLDKGAHVLWITHPFSLLAYLKRRLWKLNSRIWSVWVRGGRKFTFPDKTGTLVNIPLLTPIQPVGKLPVLESYPLVTRYLACSLPRLSKVIKSFTANEPSIHIFDADGGLDSFRLIPADVKIFRFSDIVEGFRNPPKGRVRLQEEIISEADLVLPVSRYLYEHTVRLRNTTDGIVLLPNGVNTKHFFAHRSKPPEYKDFSSPIAIFIGTMGDWFDWDMIKKVAAILADITFVFIGIAIPPRGLPTNIHLLGLRPYQDIPAYLQHADVGLIPFRNIFKVNSTLDRPLKYAEYIASDLPVVSVPYGSLKDLAPYTFFGADAPSFAEAIRTALKIPPEEKPSIKKAVKDLSWENFYQKLENVFTAV